MANLMAKVLKVLRKLFFGKIEGNFKGPSEAAGRGSGNCQELHIPRNPKMGTDDNADGHQQPAWGGGQFA